MYGIVLTKLGYYYPDILDLYNLEDVFYISYSIKDYKLSNVYFDNCKNFKLNTNFENSILRKNFYGTIARFLKRNNINKIVILEENLIEDQYKEKLHKEVKEVFENNNLIIEKIIKIDYIKDVLGETDITFFTREYKEEDLNVDKLIKEYKIEHNL